MASRRPSSPELFFEELRTAEARLPAGLIRLGPPASDADLASAQAQLGRNLPRSYLEFLRSFDGADLFHEAVVVCGVGAEAASSLIVANAGPPPNRLHPGELIIAQTPTEDLFVLEPEDPGVMDEPRVFRLSPDADERWLAGASLPRWLSATLAHQQVLYGPDGEFLLEAFEEGGEELTPGYALRQAERALKKDPGSAIFHYELGLIHRQRGRHAEAKAAFAIAAGLDPPNPWPWFDLGRAERELSQMRQAGAAFECAAEAASGGQRARFLTWSARSFFEAGERATAQRLLEQARETYPSLGDELRRAAEAAEEDADREARQDAEALAALVTSGLPVSRKLPVLREAAAPAPRRPSKNPAPKRPTRTTRPAPHPRKKKRRK